ncbi:MAG: helix-turn-helix domain-containing protein [Acidobacteriota bacterium]|nr:helix-turn-helix domain-containing protein [Acidobacteriota bacterium]
MIANSASITIDANADIHYNANADIHYNANVKDNPKTQGQILDSGANDASAVAARAESHLTVAARERGLNIKELAALMGVGPSHLSQVARGKKALTLYMRGKIQAVLGEVPPQGVVHRQGGVVRGGESTYLRERARERGMTLRQVADRTGLTYGYVVQVSRGQRNLSPAAQARMESVLDAPVKIEAAQCPAIDPNALWERMDAHGWSQNETARRAGISNGMLSQVMNGKRTPSGDVLRRLHQVLFAPSPAELVAPVELKVMAWKKDGRNGVVIKGAGGPRSNGKPGDGTIRVGGRVPWGAEVEFAYTTGYDSHGRVSVNHVVDERGCSAMLKQPQGGSD